MNSDNAFLQLLKRRLFPTFEQIKQPSSDDVNSETRKSELTSDSEKTDASSSEKTYKKLHFAHIKAIAKFPNNCAINAPKVVKAFDQIAQQLYPHPFSVPSVMITGCRRSEGRTTSAIQLALALGRIQKARVLLCGLDLEQSTLANQLGVVAEVSGFQKAFSGEEEIEEAIVYAKSENVYVLSAPQNPPASFKLFSTSHASHLFAQLHASFDMIVFDTSPWLSDDSITSLLASRSGGAILTVRAYREESDVIDNIASSVASYGAKVFGVILNHGAGA